MSSMHTTKVLKFAKSTLARSAMLIIVLLVDGTLLLRQRPDLTTARQQADQSKNTGPTASLASVKVGESDALYDLIIHLKRSGISSFVYVSRGTYFLGVAMADKSRATQLATGWLSVHPEVELHIEGSDGPVSASKPPAVAHRLTSTETGALSTWTYVIANRMVTSVSTGGPTTYAYSPNGNQTTVTDGPADTVIAMSYDKENRLVSHQETVGGDSEEATLYTYDGDGLKRSEYQSPNPPTTLIWDGGLPRRSLRWR